jgi:hypothetical protein
VKKVSLNRDSSALQSLFDFLLASLNELYFLSSPKLCKFSKKRFFSSWIFSPICTITTKMKENSFKKILLRLTPSSEQRNVNYFCESPSKLEKEDYVTWKCMSCRASIFHFSEHFFSSFFFAWRIFHSFVFQVCVLFTNADHMWRPSLYVENWIEVVSFFFLIRILGCVCEVWPSLGNSIAD